MKYRLGLALFVLAFGLAVHQATSRTFHDTLEAYAESLRQTFNPKRTADPQIVLIGIDDQAMQPQYFQRRVHAKILRQLANCHVRLIFFDIIFDENRDQATDRSLLDALMAAPPTVLAGASAIIDTESGEALRPPQLAPHLSPALASGHVTLSSIEKAPSTDGTNWPYLVAIDFGKGEVPSAALAMFSLYQAVKPTDLHYGSHFIEVPPLKIPIHLDPNQDTGLSISQFDLKFHGPATGPGHRSGPGRYRVIPYLDLLHPSPELRASLQDCVVVIGENTSSDNDLVSTPVGQIKGFEVHAQAFDRLLHQDFTQTLGARTNAMIATVLIGTLAILALLRWPLPWLLLAGPALGISYTALNFWLSSHYHLTFDLFTPLCGLLAAYSGLILVRLVLTSRFLGRFIPIEAARGIQLDRTVAQATRATVIVTDIRGYTTLSETRTPVQMLQLLNEYHSVTVDIYHKHGGSVLTFQGDAQLIVFGYPRRIHDATAAAVAACIEVMDAIDVLRTQWGITERKNFDVGAGICTGLVYIGDIGSHDQANYTVIGEVVRTSHKVQSMSSVLEGNVLLDEPSYAACKRKPTVTKIPNVTLEGFPDPKTLYRVEPPPR